MKKKLYIQSYSHLRNNSVFLNGAKIFENKNVDFSTFIKSVYKDFNIDYPKFFKMDRLSKLAFLAADVLLNHERTPLEKEENIAIVLSNRASSLDTDRRHQESIENASEYYPSPAVFVYTLPNICIGEISIKHKLFSENSFFIFDSFNPDYLFDYSNNLLQTNKAKKVLCGWVEFDNGQYEAFLYLVEKEGENPHSIKEINRLYKTLWEI